ncbi:polysaccharide biosynthesis protein [Salinarimonas soli]|uniref:NAD-dependent epimerase/dehydratase family protein n=1 Tax=Salinarimonas soli TaxID=1638099 RepID=A0A5B2VUI2_9HYPH|nr:polysaccharide biosynthesis protein [Salinarimonas soli]KAA2242340.1 NAD-dependent epimerase/dehydratase family protein [Salinarimonas soli]
MQLQSSADLIRRIQTLAPPGSVPDEGVIQALRAATRELIRAKRAEGCLDESPMHLAMTRTVALHEEAARARLAGRRVLVTGGSGCVGTRLRTLLQGFGPAALVNLDIAAHHGPGTGIRADIRDPDALDAAFARFRPEVVFHLAGIREPGRAELVVREAIDTNVFGTGNVIEACRRHGVAQAVYSSTGKCFAYITDHVYTGTKKLAEAQWMAAARQGGPTAFAMTRFTHILENGVVSRDIADGIRSGIVSLHGADRHFNLQNLGQATHLLVNALALAGRHEPDTFWAAADLGWPVNTLELALDEIERSGSDAAVRFLGVPKGYDEQFFRGQFDWSGDYDHHPLVNAFEAPTAALDETGTMLRVQVRHAGEGVLQAELGALRAALGPEAAGQSAKAALLTAVENVASDIFGATDPARLADVLWWGAAPAWAGPDAAGAARFERLIGLLADALLTSLPPGAAARDEALGARLDDIAATLDRIPALARRARRMRESLRSLAEAGA